MTETAKRKLILINPAALDELVSLNDAIAIVDMAMREFSTGQVGAPQRAVMTVNPATRLGLMPGTMPGLGRFGLKVVSLSSDAPKFGLSSHQGMMLLFDDATGQPLCAVECHALTRLRTAAASAVATRALSRPDSKILTIIGNGALAGAHIDAISAVRPIEQVIVWGRQRGKVEAMVQSLPKFLNQNISVVNDIRQAVGLADIICTVTAVARAAGPWRMAEARPAYQSGRLQPARGRAKWMTRWWRGAITSRTRGRMRWRRRANSATPSKPGG